MKDPTDLTEGEKYCASDLPVGATFHHVHDDEQYIVKETGGSRIKTECIRDKSSCTTSSYAICIFDGMGVGAWVDNEDGSRTRIIESFDEAAPTGEDRWNY